MELSVHAKRNGELPLKGRIRQVLTKKRPVAGVIELQSFEYENVKLAVRVGKGTHTIDLSNFHKLRAHYDVSDRVTLSNSGHPSFDSIDSVERELFRDLREALGGGHPHACQN